MTRSGRTPAVGQSSRESASADHEAPPAGPLVSVVVPVYNGEPFLRESLESVLAQTYSPLEVLVMDDASTDGTGDLVRSLGGRVRHVRNDVNLGQFPNVNRGLELASGELVAVFHADDVYDPDIVAEAVRALEAHPAAAACFCKDRFIDPSGKQFGALELPGPLRGGGLLSHDVVLDGLLRYKNHFLRTPGAVVRRPVYEQLGGFRTDLGTAADFEMWLRISRHHPIVLLDRHLYSYRQRPDSEGMSYQRMRLEPDLFFDIVREHLDQPGAPHVASQARRAFRAHEAADRVLTAARAYAAGDAQAFRRSLAPVRLLDLVRSRHVQRTRMTVLLLCLRVLRSAPRSTRAALLIRRRWGAPS